MKTMGMFLALSTLGGMVQELSANVLYDAGIVQQDNQCIGVVKDSSGETIIGASVLVKGTVNGTVTDMDGHTDVRRHDGVQRHAGIHPAR